MHFFGKIFLFAFSKIMTILEMDFGGVRITKEEEFRRNFNHICQTKSINPSISHQVFS